MSESFGRFSIVLALGAFLTTGADASADTIWLNEKGLAQKAAIAEGIKPARLFDDSNGLYIRCRILGARPAAWGSGPPTIQFEAWSPKGADDAEWSAMPYELGGDVIASIQHEVDGHLDLQLMLSSRDEADGAGATAPMGTAPWRLRMRRALDPGNALGSVVARPGVPEAKPETAAELARISHRGWVIYQLAEDPLPTVPLPDDAAGRQAYDRYMADRLKRHQDQLKADGLNLLHPRSLGRSGREAILMLIDGIARAEKYRFVATRQERESRDPAVVPALPPGMDPTGVPKDFIERATVAAGFLCTLVEMPHSSAPSRALIAPGGDRYARYGLEARDALISILEQADPDRPVPTEAARRMSPQAALPVDAAERAIAALRVVTNYATFWEAERDARRFVRALVVLARDGPPGSPPARTVLSLAARNTLVRTLRPDRAERADPRAPELGGAERAAREADAPTFRAAMDGFFTDPDPAIREAVQVVMAHAGYVDIASPRVIDELFGLATGDSIPESADRNVRRATRRYAITVLTVLGCLADPDATDADKATADRVFARLQLVRDQVEAGQGSKAQADFLTLLPELHRRVDDPELRSRAKRFLVLERDYVTGAATDARRRLKAAADGSVMLEEAERTRLFEEAKRLNRRANLPLPN